MYPNHGFSSTLSPSLQSLQGLRVLVVDNNVDSCTLLSLLLQPYGVEVRTAQLAKQAFMLCVHWQPDVIVSDIALPEENGIALIQQVRARLGAWEKRIPAIAVTGYVSEEIRQNALSQGFDLWFTKPLNFDQFISGLTSLVTEHYLSCAIEQRACWNGVLETAM